MSYDNPRIKSLNMTAVDVIVALADGNPGAVSVMMQMLKEGERIDPDNAMGGFGNLLSLDSLDCYGPRIWMFYKDVCGQSLHAMLGLMRAYQLGFLSQDKLNAAIDGDRASVDVPALLAKVKERPPAFQTEREMV